MVLTILCLMLAGPTASVPDDAFATARRFYFEAVDGRSESLARSVAILEPLHERKPEDAVVLAYLGSARLLESSRALAPWKKGKLAKEGLEMLDKAVAKAPQDLEVRFMRAASTFHLPGWFKRAEQSEADFAFVAQHAAAAVAEGRFDRRLAAASLYHHGLFREKRSDIHAARLAWTEATRIAPESRAGKDAARLLESKRG